MEEAILATLEGLEEAIEDGEESLIFPRDEQGTLVILGSNSGIWGGGKGNGGVGGRDKPTDSDLEWLDSKGEEEDEEDEEMADPNLEWMNQGPLALWVVLHKMPKRAERINIKFNPDSTVKAEDHLDNFYLQLQTLRYIMTM